MGWLTTAFTILKAIPEVFKIINQIIQLNEERKAIKRKAKVESASDKLKGSTKDKIDGIKDLNDVTRDLSN